MNFLPPSMPGAPRRPMLHPLLGRLLPRSLVGRVFAVFSLAMLVFLGAGLGLFYRYQFEQHIEETRTAR